MRTARARSLLALAVAGFTLAACSGHSDHDSSAAQQSGAQQSDGAQSDAANPHAGTNHAGATGSLPKGDGLKAGVAGYTITDIEAPRTAGKEGELEFTIRGPAGEPHKEFVLELTKLMHTYVVRKDLTEFQHVHPALDEATGRWSAPITFDKPGPYRIVTEFDALTPDGNFDGRVLGEGFTVGGGNYKATNYNPKWGIGSVAGYDLALDPKTRMHGPDLTLKITKAGADVTDLQPYLQSWAHVTGFRQGDLKVVHMHPAQSPGEDANALGGPSLNLASLFSGPGKYRLFVQFQTAGKLHTSPVDVEVADHKLEGSAPQESAPESSTQQPPAADPGGSEHSGH